MFRPEDMIDFGNDMGISMPATEAVRITRVYIYSDKRKFRVALSGERMYHSSQKSFSVARANAIRLQMQALVDEINRKMRLNKEGKKSVLTAAA